MRGLLIACAVLLAGCGTMPGAAPIAVKRVDSFPLYELTDDAKTPNVFTKEPPPGPPGWACTVFFGAGGRPIMGRNFDFHDEPALILHHDPPDGYASVSMVDISYLGFDRAHVAAKVADLRSRRRLLEASRLPFDGMNEKGLAVAMAAVPQARAPVGERATGSLGVMRLVLDGAATVPQAIETFRHVQVEFKGGPPLHYLVADAQGRSAVIEYVDGTVHVIRRGKRPYQAMTNFVISTSSNRERTHDRRYHTAMTALRAALGRITPASTLRLLERVRQPITRWSVAYDLRARTLKVVMGQRYARVLTFHVKG